jgi:4-hydroxybenzoate polyprenyltransferase
MSPIASRARVYLKLGRISNLPTVWTNVLAGLALAGAVPRAASVALLGLAFSLFYVGGMFLNDAFDREIDAKERPERPIPAGLIRADEVFAVGYGLLAAGLALVAAHAGLAGAGAAPIAAGALLGGAIVLYDAWHKGNPWSPLLMGLCRVLVYVTAALSGPGRPGLPLLGGALSLLFYLIGLTAIAKQENLRSVRSLAALGFLAVPFLYTLDAPLAGPAGLAAYAALAACVIHAVRLLRGDRKDRIPRAVVTLIAGISLLDAALIAGRGAPIAAALAMLAFPLTLALQRFVRGT